MSTTIDFLDIQITTSAGNSAANIERLANALGKLKANSKITTTVNNLTKLKTALDGLRGVSPGLQNVERIGTALSKLQGIGKLTGLASAINSLKKIPGIMTSLSTAALDEFTSKMNKLATALAPLSTRLNEVGTAFNKLPSKIQQIVTGTNRMATATNKAAAAQKTHSSALAATDINLAAVISNIQAYIGFVQGLVQNVQAFMADAIEWDGIQFRFGRAFGEDADEVYDWILKINDALDINIQQFMQYSSLYGSLLKGFGMAQEDVTTISVGLTELSYDIWAAYNDRYKTLEEASEAVRSAITGEIEPIRNAGIALTEASMQEYLDSLGMAEVRMANLSEAQKAEVRYAVMVNSAMNQGIIGTYARETETAEGAVRTLTQQLKTLAQAFGGLFLPILKVVVPWLSAFVELLTDAVRWVAALFGVELQEITWGDSVSAGAGDLADLAENAGTAGGALGDAAKAAKKLKSYTMGFDELNVINPDSASGSSSGGSGSGAGAGAGGGGSLGLDLDTLWDDSIFGQTKNKVDEIKESVLGFLDEWKTELIIIGSALAGLTIAKLLGKLGEALVWGDKFLGTIGKIQKIASSAIVITLQFALVKNAMEGFMDGEGFKKFIEGIVIAGIGSYILYSMWGPAGLAIGLGVTAVASLSAVFENGGITDVESATVALTGLASAIGSLWIALKKPMPKIDLSKLLGKSNYLNAAKAMAPEVGWLAALFPKSATILATASTWVTGTLAPALASALSSVGAALAAIPGWVVALVAAVVGTIALGFVNYDFTDLGYKLGNALGKAWGKIKDWFGGAVEWAKGIGESIKEGLIKAWDWVSETFDIHTVWDVVALISPTTWITKIIPKMIEVGAEILPGLWEGVVSWWNNLIGNITEFIDGFVQGWKDGLGISSPSKVFKEIGEFVIAGLLGGLTEKWEDIKSWFNTKIAPKLTKEYWKTKWNGVKQGATQKLDEVKKSISDKWNAIKTWFSSNVAPKFTKAYWSGKFDAIREGASAKLESVKKTIADMWESIKTWFRNNVAPKFTLSYWKNKFDDVFEAAKDVFSISKWKKLGKDALDGLFEGLGNIWNKAKTWGTDVLNSVKDVLGIHSPSVEFEELGDYCVDGMHNAFLCTDCIVESLEGLLRDIRERITEFISNLKEEIQIAVDELKENLRLFADEFITGTSELFSWLSDACSTALDELLTSLGDMVDEIDRMCSDISDMFWNMSDESVSAIQEIISALNDIPREITTVHTVVTKNVSSGGGSSGGGGSGTKSNPGTTGIVPITTPGSLLSAGATGIVPITTPGSLIPAGTKLPTVTVKQEYKLNVKPRANGGFVNTGELFIAREAGPELVGSINGRTAVANNDQIVAAVSQGVYSAVVSAMSANNSGSGEQNINVYLDGKQITAAIEKRQRERGMQLLGSQVYSY